VGVLTAVFFATALPLLWSFAYAQGEGAQKTDAPAEAKQAVTPGRIADLAWLAGRWVGNVGEDTIEESWNPPIGDCMVGSFRWVKKDAVWMYELLTVAEENGSLVLRFRHFDRGLIPWEEKEKPLTFHLKSIKDGEAVFTINDPANPWTLVYRREGNKLTVAVGDKTFELTRAK